MKRFLIVLTIITLLAFPAYADVTIGGGVSSDSAAITGGTIDGTTIGSTTPAAGTFTSLLSTGFGQVENIIGIPGNRGFGVGICPASLLPAGFTPMQGYQDPSSPNYGNYQFREGSVMVYIPKFYYRMHTWGAITGITKANPAEVTQTAHGYVNGDIIFIANVGGMTQVNNGVYAVTKTSDNTYTIGVDSSAYGAYTSGGVATKQFADGFNDTIVTYNTNSIQIRGYDTYATEAAANADGYALHRAFWDGGIEQKGFFIDKYKASKVANGGGFTAASIKGGKPLSSHSTHNPYTGLTGGANYTYSVIDLAHRRDGTDGAVNAASIFHVKSVFQNSALAMLSLAHGQYSTTTNNCAWCLVNKNYPKGCNNGAFADTDDATVVYSSDGYAGQKSCTTGSAQEFAKTTHNGQDSGVADLNGGMWEVEIGVTAIATSPAIEAWSKAAASVITVTGHGLIDGDFIQINSVTQADWSGAKDKIWAITKINDDTFSIAFDSSGFGTAYDAGTDSGTITKGTFYAATAATAMKSFTNGTTLATDHWGATGVAAKMSAFTPPFKSGFAYALSMGSGTNQVLSPATSGAGWLLTGMGVPKDGSGVDATGSNLFGKDYFYQYIVNNLCLVSSEYWTTATVAGVWSSHWYYNRTHAYYVVGFRLAAYPE